MFRYSAFGFSIHSEIAMPGLPLGGDEADIVIRRGSVPRGPARASMHEEIAHLPLGGSFHITDGREIVFDPPPSVDPDLLRVLLVGRIMAFLLRQRGWLPLHASGVEIGGEATLFLGASRSGKSTTAAVFHSLGYQVITDDVGAVRIVDGNCIIRPGGPRIRLLNDAREIFQGTPTGGFFQRDKHVFDLARSKVPELMRVRRIYRLDYGAEIGSEVLPLLTAVTALSGHSFVKHEHMDKDSLAAHVRDCAAVARSLEIYSLTRPQSLAALPELVRRVESDLRVER